MYLFVFLITPGEKEEQVETPGTARKGVPLRRNSKRCVHESVGLYD